MAKSRANDGVHPAGPRALGEVFGSIGWLPAVRLNALWSAAAGAVLASNARVTGQSGGTLTLECSSPQSNNQITENERELVQRLQSMGLAWVEGLRLEATRPFHAFHAVKKQRALGSKKSQQIQASVANVESPAIRDALERVLRAYALSGQDETNVKEKP